MLIGRFKKYSTLILFFILFFNCCHTDAKKPVIDPSPEAAANAYFRFNLPQAMELYTAVANDSGFTPKERVEAMSKLARMEWHFNEDISKARQWVKRALDTDEFKPHNWTAYAYLSRIERDAGNLEEAKGAAEKAETAARSRSEKKFAAIQFAGAVLKEAEQRSDPFDESLINDLTRAMNRLSALLDEEPGERFTSLWLLGIALRLNNGPMILKAWRSFHLVPDGEYAEGIMKEPGIILESVLSGQQGDSLNTAEKERFVMALAGSRFYGYAAALAKTFTRTDPEFMSRNTDIRDIAAYDRFLKDLSNAANKFYRQTAHGTARRDEFVDNSSVLAKDLWHNLHFTGARPEFSDKIFYETLKEKFGTVIRRGLVDNYFGIALGHIVVDEHRSVHQYGQDARLRFIALDHMVSNFYSGWFLDGMGAPGGWADPDTIYQVREAYAAGPFFEWRMATDPEERLKIEEDIQRKSKSDDELAEEDPYAYLPGLDGRMHMDYLDRILKKVDDRGYKGNSRCIAFIKEYMEITRDFTFFAHEGRHSIDQRMNPGHFVWWKLGMEGFRYWPIHEAEFRAKLSEIAFSTDPQMTFASSIYSNNMNADTGHGQANKRIVETIVNWMDRHRDEIGGLDKKRPLLPQFQLLTDEQIKSAVREADPLFLKYKEGLK